MLRVGRQQQNTKVVSRPERVEAPGHGNGTANMPGCHLVGDGALHQVGILCIAGQRLGIKPRRFGDVATPGRMLGRQVGSGDAGYALGRGSGGQHQRCQRQRQRENTWSESGILACQVSLHGGSRGSGIAAPLSPAIHASILRRSH